MDANTTAGSPRLLIDARALATNVRVIRRGLAPTVQVTAVIKADAYGLDAKLIAQLLTLIEEDGPFTKVDRYAVATAEEAAALGTVTKPIMLLRPIENVFLGRQREALEYAIRHGWTLTLSSPAAADDVARVAMHLQQRADVQLMLDTGLTRCGCPADRFDDLVERVLAHASLNLVAVCTHLVNGEVAGDPLTTRQLRLFDAAVANHPILDNVPKHVANSGGLFLTPRSHYDAVRPGLSLYGIDPTGRPNIDRPLVPVMKWTAPVMAIHDIVPGQGVGYGHAWTALAPTRVALLPVGYADGYPRSASNRAMAMLHNTPCGVVGRVSMDMLTIDVTRVPDVCVGDEVTLVDADPLSPASLYALCRATDMIPYEILTGIGARVRRVPVGVEAEALVD
ncbi:MAG TPA: alanine racemase [Tepidisphaeraceae bacterium]|jgi:alanine racemase